MPVARASRLRGLKPSEEGWEREAHSLLPSFAARLPPVAFGSLVCKRNEGEEVVDGIEDTKRLELKNGKGFDYGSCCSGYED